MSKYNRKELLKKRGLRINMVHGYAPFIGETNGIIIAVTNQWVIFKHLTMELAIRIEKIIDIK